MQKSAFLIVQSPCLWSIYRMACCSRACAVLLPLYNVKQIEVRMASRMKRPWKTVMFIHITRKLIASVSENFYGIVPSGYCNILLIGYFFLKKYTPSANNYFWIDVVFKFDTIRRLLFGEGGGRQKEGVLVFEEKWFQKENFWRFSGRTILEWSEWSGE